MNFLRFCVVFPRECEINEQREENDETCSKHAGTNKIIINEEKIVRKCCWE